VYRFAGYNVTVPLSYVKCGTVRHAFPECGPEDWIYLLRLRPVFAWTPWQGETIEIMRAKSGDNTGRWRSVPHSAFDGDGLTGSKAIDLQFAGASIRCVQSSKERRIAVICMSESGVILQYFGDDQNLSRFRDFLSNDVRPASQ
jgi:hypothetical protein